jgi:hypothetical protein
MQLVIALLLVAQNPAPESDSNVTVTAPNEAKICRSTGADRSSASRISRRRVCLTPTQWRQRERDNTEDAADTLDVQNPGLSTDVPNQTLDRRTYGGMAPR